MPHYNWRRPNSLSSNESPKSRASFDSDILPPSPPLRLGSSPGQCPTCDTKYDENNECKQPRILPCLHSFCTQCLMRVYDYLEILNAAQNSLKTSRPASRYSWRNRHSSPTRSSSPSKSQLLGHFICPMCHNATPIHHLGNRLDSIKTSFPLDQLYALTDSNPSSSDNKSLLNLVVQEIQPKIRVIQKAVFETETAKQTITDNVQMIEHRLMPAVPSESEAVTRIRTELLEQLHKVRTKRLNAIVKRQVILKQCEKVNNDSYPKENVNN